MKLDTEQEIINLKAIIEDREEEIVRKYQMALTRKYLCTSSTFVPSGIKEVASHD